MTREDFSRGLRALDREDIRDKVAAGNLGALEDLDLSEEEVRLLQQAAKDYPEVSGFAFDAFLEIGDIKGESSKRDHKNWIEALSAKPGTSSVIRYLGQSWPPSRK